ncbi:TetR/AcrR family transcriptional regulator [Yoonia sp. BS5-3]|uniref:TetR/AcrR family transcriptional regulator n=1 Tax=Yoonia phaeophyticola TaxID=3137369 RepID=A0ABZ2V9A9_9RHOB
MAQQPRSQEKVDRILNTTLEMLASDPLQSVGTKSIAAQSGVSVGTIYRFFPNKEAIYYELYQRWLGQSLAALDQLIDNLQGDVTLEEFTDAFLQVMSDHELNANGYWHLRMAMGVSRKLIDLEAKHRMDVGRRIVLLQNTFGKLPHAQIAPQVMFLQNEITIACLFSLSQFAGNPNEDILKSLCKRLFLLIFDFDEWGMGI